MFFLSDAINGKKQLRAMAERLRPRLKPCDQTALDTVNARDDWMELSLRLMNMNLDRPDEEKEQIFGDILEYLELAYAGLQTFVAAHAEKWGKDVLRNDV